MVGAKSAICPRCGVSFKAAAFHRAIIWIITVGLIGWGVMHFWMKRI
jgi:hypothetical protein